MQYYSAPVCSISHNKFLIYCEQINPKPRTELQIQNEKHLKNVKYNGFMSPQTRRKVEKYLSTWIGSVRLASSRNVKDRSGEKRYISFLTLTLAAKQVHTDQEIKRDMLNKFIVYLRRKHGIENYFWRAESQKNGNIHFHLILDKYVKKGFIDGIWNSCQESMGYLDIFERAHGHRNPPSCKIHKLEKINKVEAYLLKYVTKQDGYRPIKGRIHGCSDSIKNLKPFNVWCSVEVTNMIRKAANSDKFKVVEGECFTIIQGNVIGFMKRNYHGVYKDYCKFMNDIFDRLYIEDDNSLALPSQIIAEMGESRKEVKKEEIKQLNLFDSKQWDSKDMVAKANYRYVWCPVKQEAVKEYFT